MVPEEYQAACSRRWRSSAWAHLNLGGATVFLLSEESAWLTGKTIAMI
jgi:hypothetical protein